MQNTNPKIVKFIEDNIESLNYKINYMNNPTDGESHFGKDELMMQLGTALYYQEKIENNDTADIDNLTMIVEDRTIYRLLEKYNLHICDEFVYIYNKENNIVDVRLYDNVTSEYTIEDIRQSFRYPEYKDSYNTKDENDEDIPF
jgi:hypothetical protein